MTAPMTFDPGSTRPCGVHQTTLAAAKNRWTSSPGATRCSSTFSSMTSTVPRGGERLRRVREVVHTFEERDQVVPATLGGDLVDVAHLEVDAVGDAVLGGVAAGAGDRFLVVVVAVDAGGRVGLGELDRGPPR